jgi:predicted transcriptional regulator
MPTLIELTAQIVAAHAGNTQMTSEELFQDLQRVHASLMVLESGVSAEQEQTKQLTIKQAFKKDEVICMVCRKGGFKTLKKHLAIAHQLTPGQYRKQFGIPSSQSLAARSYSESRRQTAIESGLGENLAKAREIRAANMKRKKAAVPAVKIKPPVPAVKAKASVPALKTKASVPAVKHKAPVPAKVQVTKAPPKSAQAAKKK